MIITFLGTGASQGVPVIGCSCATCRSPNSKNKRLRSAIHLAEEDKRLLIDAGPDLRQQLLAANLTQIDALLLTHEHRDHVGGFNELGGLSFAQKSGIQVYASAHVHNRLQEEFYYLFEEAPLRPMPAFQLNTIDSAPFTVEGFAVMPIQVLHGTLPILGFRIGGLTYITDAKYIADEEVAKMRGTTVLVVNALQQQAHHAHFNLQEAIALAERVAAKTTYITHVGHCLGLHEEVSKELPPNIHLAYDGLQLRL